MVSDDDEIERRVAPGSRKAKQLIQALSRHRDQIADDIRAREAIGQKAHAWKYQVCTALDWILDLAEAREQLVRRGDGEPRPLVTAREMDFHHTRFGILVEMSQGRWSEDELAELARAVAVMLGGGEP